MPCRKSMRKECCISFSSTAVPTPHYLSSARHRCPYDQGCTALHVLPQGIESLLAHVCCQLAQAPHHTVFVLGVVGEVAWQHTVGLAASSVQAVPVERSMPARQACLQEEKSMAWRDGLAAHGPSPFPSPPLPLTQFPAAVPRLHLWSRNLGKAAKGLQ